VSQAKCATEEKKITN